MTTLDILNTELPEINNSDDDDCCKPFKIPYKRPVIPPQTPGVSVSHTPAVSTMISMLDIFNIDILRINDNGYGYDDDDDEDDCCEPCIPPIIVIPVPPVIIPIPVIVPVPLIP